MCAYTYEAYLVAFWYVCTLDISIPSSHFGVYTRTHAHTHTHTHKALCPGSHAAAAAPVSLQPILLSDAELYDVLLDSA